MRLPRRLRSIPLAATLLATTMLTPDQALAGPKKPANIRHAAIVMDPDTGTVLKETSADKALYPASLTKLMTLYLTFEALEAERITLDQTFTATRLAAAQPPTELGLKPGDKITVDQAIRALVVHSANDAAMVLAEGVGGTKEDFVAAMNAKARALGMKSTHFANPNGLPDATQLSTARDMARLARALMRDFPDRYSYFSTRSFAWKGQRWNCTNKLLGQYKGLDGLKTGYVRASGFNLVAHARRNGRRVLAVLFGGSTAAARNKEMVRLLDYGFAQQAEPGVPQVTSTRRLKAPRP